MHIYRWPFFWLSHAQKYTLFTIYSLFYENFLCFLLLFPLKCQLFRVECDGQKSKLSIFSHHLNGDGNSCATTCVTSFSLSTRNHLILFFFFVLVVHQKHKHNGSVIDVAIKSATIFSNKITLNFVEPILDVATYFLFLVVFVVRNCINLF